MSSMDFYFRFNKMRFLVYITVQSISWPDREMADLTLPGNLLWYNIF